MGSGVPQWSNDPSFLEGINSQITLAYKGGYNGICLDLESGSINGKSLDKIFSHSKTINSKAKTVLVITGNTSWFIK